MEIILGLFKLAFLLCSAYVWIILGYCLLGMAAGFGLIDVGRHKLLIALMQTFSRLVEPALQPLRAIMPNTGMMDFSPLILLIIVQYLIPYVLREALKMIYALHGV